MGNRLNIREYVYNVLEPIGAPVWFRHWVPIREGDTPPPTYITFIETLEQSELSADDYSWEYGRYIDVDIWSEYPTENIDSLVHTAMSAADFIHRDSQDINEMDTGTFHRVTRWLYLEEVK